MTTMKYAGAGTYIHGVPARDLTEDEATRYAAVIREQEALTGAVIYQPVAVQPVAASKRGAKAAEEGDND